MAKDIRILWTIDVVDKGAGQQLLKEDRTLRSSLTKTDEQYRKTAATATASGDRQKAAATAVVAANDRQSKAILGVNSATAAGVRVTRDLAGAQDASTRAAAAQTAAARSLAGELRAQAAAADAAHAAQKRLNALRAQAGKAVTGAASGAVSGLGSAASGVGSAALLGAKITGGSVLAGVGAAGVLTIEGLKRGTEIRAGAAGLSGVTGLDPRTATALAIIAQAEQVNARGLSQAFTTIGKQVTALGQAKVPKATTENFARLGISTAQAQGLQNNLPALFDLVFQRASKLPAAERAATLKTFLGRGASLSGQVELGGPLTTQLKQVRGELGSLDPKHLAELHEQEIRLHETTTALELSFASTFGPPLIKLMELITPAIKPAGEALRSAFGSALDFIKGSVVPFFKASLLPVIEQVGEKVGKVGKTVGDFIGETASKVPGVVKEAAAGIVGAPTPPSRTSPRQVPTFTEPVTRERDVPLVYAPGHAPSKEPLAQSTGKVEAEASVWKKAGETISRVFSTIVSSAAQAGKELLVALKPALPVFRALGEAALIVGKAVLGGLVVAWKIAIPIVKVAATIVGGLSRAFSALPGPVKAAVLALAGWVFLAPKIKSATETIALSALYGIDKMKALPGRVTGYISAIPGRISGFAGKVRGAGVAVADAAQAGFGALKSIGSKVAGWVAAVPGAIRSVAGKAAAAAGVIVNAITTAMSALGGALAGIARSAGAKFATLMGEAGAAAGSAFQLTLIAGLGAAAFFIGKWVAGLIHVSVDATPPFLHIHIGNAKLPTGPSIEERATKAAEEPFSPGKTNHPFREKGQGGGLVGAMVSPGEQVIYGGASWMVPGARTAADSVYAHLPVGAAVLTSSGQAMVRQGASVGEAIAMQAPHFATGGFVATAYGPPWEGIEGTGTTATGVNLKSGPKAYIVAVDPKVIALHTKLRINPNPFNYTGDFAAEDTGGAIKGKRIDFYDWKGRADQERWGKRPVSVSRGSGAAGSGAFGKGSSTIDTMLAKAARSGILPDAALQAMEAGASGGPLGAVLEAITGAIGSVSTKVKAAGLGGGTAAGGGKLPKGLSTPNATWNPGRKSIADWIVPYLKYGASHGWNGTVTSGYRSRQEQAAIYNSGVRPAAKPGTSKHEGVAYPSGAVDVDRASAPVLANVLGKEPGPHLLKWAGSEDPVHFSHPVNGTFRRGGILGYRSGGVHPSTAEEHKYRSMGQTVWNRLSALRALPALARVPAFVADQRFARGGIVGAGVNTSGIAAAIGTAALPAAEAALAHTLEGATLRYLATQRALLGRLASQAGSARTIKAFQAAISTIDAVLGYRVGKIQATIAARAGGGERLSAAFDRSLRSRGIEATSVAGLELRVGNAAQRGLDAKVVDERRKSLAEARAAVRTARGTHNPAVIKKANEEVVAAEEGLDESLTQWTEDRAALAKAAVEAQRQAAQDSVDRASAAVSAAQNTLTFDAVERRRAGVSESSPGGERAKASEIESSLVPALRAQLVAAEANSATMVATSASLQEQLAAQQAVGSATTEIASAMAEAADLIREATETAAAEVVEHAQHATNLANIGEQRLELEQRIAGTFEGGGAQRAEYINQQVIPALRAELSALQEQAAADAGNPKLAEQIGEAVAQKQNDILSATLQATEQIAKNQDRKLGGTLGFTFGNESLTDAIIGVGSGA